MNRSKQLAGFMSALRLENMSKEIPDFLKFCLLDHLGCALGALGTEEAGVHLRAAEAASGNGPCTIIGRDFGADPATAALTNGILAHVLIFDDLHRKSKLHPGVAVIPAALAACELGGTDGKTFLEAVSAGYETAARVGMAVNMAAHRLKGWRATGTCGSFGAAAASRAILYLTVSFHFMKKALQEVRKTGDYTGMTHEEFMAARQGVEDLIGLEGFYEVEEETVEKKKWGKR